MKRCYYCGEQATTTRIGRSVCVPCIESKEIQKFAQKEGDLKLKTEDLRHKEPLGHFLDIIHSQEQIIKAYQSWFTEFKGRKELQALQHEWDVRQNIHR